MKWTDWTLVLLHWKYFNVLQVAGCRYWMLQPDCIQTFTCSVAAGASTTCGCWVTGLSRSLFSDAGSTFVEAGASPSSSAWLTSSRALVRKCSGRTTWSEGCLVFDSMLDYHYKVREYVFNHPIFTLCMYSIGNKCLQIAAEQNFPQ